MVLNAYANNKGLDQSVHPHTLISVRSACTSRHSDLSVFAVPTHQDGPEEIYRHKMKAVTRLQGPVVLNELVKRSTGITKYTDSFS